MDKNERLDAWVQAGMSEDDVDKFGITLKDVRRLEKRVMKAIAAKMLQRPDVVTFAEHRTLQ